MFNNPQPSIDNLNKFYSLLDSNKSLKTSSNLKNALEKKNKYIIAAVFWFLSSLYIYSNDSGFSDVYSLKPFIYFIVGPVVASIVFGNIMFFLQKIIEKGVIAFLGNNAQNLVLPVISFIFFCALVGMFLIIFKFAELLQTVI